MEDYDFSIHALDVMNNRNIQKDWVLFTIKNYTRKDENSNNEHWYFSIIEEYENRCLKVVVNPIRKIIITTFFDRGMRKKGCKDED